MKTVLYIAGGYLALVGAMQIYSNTAANTPTADAFSQLPSFNSATVNVLVGGAAIAAAYFKLVG